MTRKGTRTVCTLREMRQGYDWSVASLTHEITSLQINGTTWRWENLVMPGVFSKIWAGAGWHWYLQLDSYSPAFRQAGPIPTLAWPTLPLLCIYIYSCETGHIYELMEDGETEQNRAEFSLGEQRLSNFELFAVWRSHFCTPLKMHTTPLSEKTTKYPSQGSRHVPT